MAIAHKYPVRWIIGTVSARLVVGDYPVVTVECADYDAGIWTVTHSSKPLVATEYTSIMSVIEGISAEYQLPPTLQVYGEIESE